MPQTSTDDMNIKRIKDVIRHVCVRNQKDKPHLKTIIVKYWKFDSSKKIFYILISGHSILIYKCVRNIFNFPNSFIMYNRF